MFTWLNVRSTLLDDMVGLDGPGDSHPNLCNLCSNSQSAPSYRCLECSHSLLYCSKCIVKLHKMLPLHRVEVSFLFYCTITFAHVTPSTGGTGSLTEHPSIRLGSFVILGTAVTHVSSNPSLTISPLLTPTVGIGCESGSVPVTRAPRGVNVTDS